MFAGVKAVNQTLMQIQNKQQKTEWAGSKQSVRVDKLFQPEFKKMN